MLMQLTDLEGRPVGVNPEQVQNVRTTAPEDEPRRTCLYLSSGGGGSFIEVRETVEEVIAMVNSRPESGPEELFRTAKHEARWRWSNPAEPGSLPILKKE